MASAPQGPGGSFEPATVLTSYGEINYNRPPHDSKNAVADVRRFDLRDEERGGVRRFPSLGDGAFATSRFAGRDGIVRQASVTAPLCLLADALTKLVVTGGDVRHALLDRFGARAWLHAPSPQCERG